MDNDKEHKDDDHTNADHIHDATGKVIPKEK